MLVLEFLLGTALFILLVGITVGLGYLLSWAAAFGMEPWVQTTFKVLKGVALVLESIVYLAFLLKIAYSFLLELKRSD